ncbi:tubulin polyglutamylase TTLL11 isoform X7 [Mustelus asterias]
MSQQQPAAAAGGSEAEPQADGSLPRPGKEERAAPGAKEKPASTIPTLPPPGLPLAARRALASLSAEVSKSPRRSRRAEDGRLGRGHGRQKKKNNKRAVTVDSSKAKTSSEALRICIQQLKWKEFPTGRRLLCDIYWHGVSFHDGEVSCSGQVNKYPGMTELVRKINFSRAVRTMQELFPEEYKFYPRSWILPEEYQNFADQILGFDILLMKNMKPVLLEVNANPSMRIEHEQEISPGLFEYVASPVDEEIKVAIIRDTLRLVDPALKKNCLQQSLSTECSAESDKEETAEAEAQDVTETPSNKEQNLAPLCLKQVFPKYSRQFGYLLIVDRIALLFIRFLGIKGTMKLGPTGFRTFIRTCKLSNSNLSMASVDILYIDIARRWNVIRGDRGESVTDCSPAASFNPNGWDNLGCRFCRNNNQSCSVMGLKDVRSQRVKLTQILHPSVTSYFM